MPHRLITALTAGILVALLSGAAGCASSSASLDGTEWKLTEWTVSSLNPADFTITAAFSEGQISGTSGVNSYGGPYKTGRGREFSVGQIAGTLMAGPEPAMRAESAYLKLLAQAKSYAVTGDALTLYDDGGNVTLVFESDAE